jgi:hypothetical protein
MYKVGLAAALSSILLTFAATDARASLLGDVAGILGLQGPPGPTGPAGPTGPTGPQGPPAAASPPKWYTTSQFQGAIASAQGGNPAITYNLSALPAGTYVFFLKTSVAFSLQPNPTAVRCQLGEMSPFNYDEFFVNTPGDMVQGPLTYVTIISHPTVVPAISSLPVVCSSDAGTPFSYHLEDTTLSALPIDPSSSSF